MEHTSLHTRRARRALSQMGPVTVAKWMCLISLALLAVRWRTFRQASRLFPLRWFGLHLLSASFLLAAINPKPNWVRFAVVHSGALAVTVTAYSIYVIARGARLTSGGG